MLTRIGFLLLYLSYHVALLVMRLSECRIFMQVTKPCFYHVCGQSSLSCTVRESRVREL